MTAALDHVIPSKSCHASIYNHQPTLLETSFAQHISDLQPMYTTTLANECNCKQTDIPQKVILGHLQAMQTEDMQVYEDAADNTATTPAESWIS